MISVVSRNELSSSPLKILTQKQREVIIKAFQLGYYDIPRKASSFEAVKLGMNQSTFTEHRIMEWLNSNYSQHDNAFI